MSTQAARCEEGRKAMSPVKPSKLRSKAVPINWPLLLNTGLPEFPPVLSVFTALSIFEALQIPSYPDLLSPLHL